MGLFQYFEDVSSNGGSPVWGSPMDSILELNKQKLINKNIDVTLVNQFDGTQHGP